MNDQKLRIRFRKTGDLRWISHRDLARVFERLFRRANVPLAMSQGFHPHPRINFPSALSLGIASNAEWVEAMLSDDVSATIQQQLAEQAPPGLEIIQVWILDRSHPKPVVDRSTYTVTVPEDRCASAHLAIQTLIDANEYLITRGEDKQSIDLLESLIEIELQDQCLRFSLRALRTAQARPREILAAIGLADLEQLGRWLTRTEVHLQETTN